MRSACGADSQQVGVSCGLLTTSASRKWVVAEALHNLEIFAAGNGDGGEEGRWGSKGGWGWAFRSSSNPFHSFFEFLLFLEILFRNKKSDEGKGAEIRQYIRKRVGGETKREKAANHPVAPLSSPPPPHTHTPLPLPLFPSSLTAAQQKSQPQRRTPAAVRTRGAGCPP